MHVDDRKTEGVVKNSTGRNIRRRRYGAALCTAGWRILHQLRLHGLWPRAATGRNTSCETKKLLKTYNPSAGGWNYMMRGRSAYCPFGYCPFGYCPFGTPVAEAGLYSRNSGARRLTPCKGGEGVPTCPTSELRGCLKVLAGERVEGGGRPALITLPEQNTG